MRLLITMILFLCWSVTAHACRLTRALTTDEMAMAQTVFLGTVIKYHKPQKSERRLSLYTPSTITFEVQEVLSGRMVAKQITLNWYPNWNVAHPDSLDAFIRAYGTLTRIGIVYPETFPEDSNIPSILSPKESAHPVIIRGACSTPFLYPANEKSTIR